MNAMAQAVFSRVVEPGRVAAIEMLDDIAAAEPVWRALERHGAMFTPYQRYEWIALWQQHVGGRNGTTPFLVVGRCAAGEPLFLWPLALSRRGPMTVATFFSGKHANLNFALWRPDYGSRVTAAELTQLLERISVVRTDVDFLMLLNQPTHWNGLLNPFTLLPHQPSPSAAYKLRLGASGEEVIARQLSQSMRSRLRQKERSLQKLAGYRFYRAETATEVSRLLDAFFAQKATRFRAQGIRNVFAERGVESYIRDACCTDLSAGRQVIELYAIEADEEVLAIRGGINNGRRFSCLFNSFTQGTHSRQSPGLILTAKVIADCADRGFDFFDLGVGEANYKDLFCNEPEPLFDSFLPLTPVGRLAVGAARLMYAQKGKLKSSPKMWAAVQACRRVASRLAA